MFSATGVPVPKHPTLIHSVPSFKVGEGVWDGQLMCAAWVLSCYQGWGAGNTNETRGDEEELQLPTLRATVNSMSVGIGLDSPMMSRAAPQPEPDQSNGGSSLSVIRFTVTLPSQSWGLEKCSLQTPPVIGDSMPSSPSLWW